MAGSVPREEHVLSGTGADRVPGRGLETGTLTVNNVRRPAVNPADVRHQIADVPIQPWHGRIPAATGSGVSQQVAIHLQMGDVVGNIHPGIQARWHNPQTAPTDRRYSHSMEPGGLLVMSRTTRLICSTSLVMREEICASTSYGMRDQSAVMASSLDTGRMTIGWP